MTLRDPKIDTFADVLREPPPGVKDITLESLKRVIPRDTPVESVTYKYGDKICVGGRFQGPRSTDGNHQRLAFILSGCVEIADEILFNGYVGHRPIRIARTGEILGDIAASDLLLTEPPPWTGETWIMVAGVGSIYCKKRLVPNDIGDALEEITGKPYFNPKEYQLWRDALALLGDVPPDHKTRLLYFYPEQIRSNQALCELVVRSALKRALQYRLSFNAFNYPRLVQYRAYSGFLISSLRGSRKFKKNRNRISDSMIHDYALPEMLFDAINRPFRHEPVFVSLGSFPPEEQLKMLPADQLEPLSRKLKVELDDFLIPAVLDPEHPEHYCFPLDQNNYFLLQWIQMLCDAEVWAQQPSSVNRWNLFKEGSARNFLASSLRMCLSDDRLYEAAHRPGSELQDPLRPTVRCELQEFGGQLFGSYRMSPAK
jgi:hypothetical protein